MHVDAESPKQTTTRHHYRIFGLNGHLRCHTDPTARQPEMRGHVTDRPRRVDGLDARGTMSGREIIAPAPARSDERSGHAGPHAGRAHHPAGPVRTETRATYGEYQIGDE